MDVQVLRGFRRGEGGYNYWLKRLKGGVGHGKNTELQ